MRINLKIAILEDGSSQRRVAAATAIPENRLSEIVCGWTDPRPDERARLEAVLGRRHDLFDMISAEQRSARR